MTRKQLPRAIARTNENPRQFGAGAAVDEEVQSPRSASRYDAVEAEPALAISSRSVANDPFPAASIHAQALAAKRRSLARKIIERHKFYAAGGGLLPLPIVNVAGVTAIIVRMVKRLSDLYEVPFERDRTRSFVVGVMGGAAPTGLGLAAATTATLAFAVPTSALVGLAVSAVTAAAVTRGIGLVFVEHFESGATSLGVAEAD